MRTVYQGLVIGSIISARFGRRVCIFSMSCYALVTATIAITSKTKEQILMARILNYVYVGMELSVVPIYQSEVVPAPVRGFMVGSYQLSLAVSISGQYVLYRLPLLTLESWVVSSSMVFVREQAQWPQTPPGRFLLAFFTLCQQSSPA